MIHLDTSVLVAALGPVEAVSHRLRGMVADGERPSVCTVVLYEWWRGPRTAAQLADQEVLLPISAAVPFGAVEARIAADLYGRMRRARDREVDIAIAACAISHGAALWTLNRRDFADIPGLELI